MNGEVGGYTDSAGAVRGDENARFWDANGTALLTWSLPGNGLVWHPYLEGSVHQQFGYSYTLDVPGDIISYGHAQTVVRARGGINARYANGIVVGAEGYVADSQEYETLGARAYVRYYFPQ